MHLTLTFDGALRLLRESSTITSSANIEVLPGTIALEHGREIVALSGDLFLLARELLDGLNKMLSGHCPTLLLMGETES